MVETTLTQDELLAALHHPEDEVRFVMECLTKAPPEGIVEIEGGSIWTGLAHDWVFDELANCWRAPDEALRLAVGSPPFVQSLTFELGLPNIGWMPVHIQAGAQVSAFEASTVFDPFEALTPWLEAIAAGQLARLLINIEGVNMGLHVVEPDGETVRFVVTNDSEEALVHEIDVRIGRAALVQGIYLPFVETWESDLLAGSWRREWRYDDDDDPDPEGPTNKPYRVRSALIDRLLSEGFELVTREDLYAQVWSQPMRTLAKSMGISDVALAKRCKSANIPVPPRGWWARKEAGKAVKVAPLPPQPFALSNYFPAREVSANRTEDGTSTDGVPQAPTFRELAAVTDEIRAAVKPIKVPSVLTAPHPIVARLLTQDAKRKPSPSASRYFPDRHGPKFQSPIQQRRLRILSSFLTELDRLGCKASGNTHAGERFSISIGGFWVYIFFGVEGGQSPSYFNNSARGYKHPDRERLRLDLVDHDDRSPPKRTWREDPDPLERHTTEILRELLIYTETETRKWALLSDKWALEERERKIREANAAAEKAEADRVARDKAAAKARIDALMAGADALEKAVRIRRYVEAVRAANASRPAPIPYEQLENWARWALAQADTLDPVTSGRFASDLSLE